MMRIAVSALTLLVLAGCSGGPKPIGKRQEPYVITSTLADPARKAVTFNISVNSQSTQDDVKAIAEQVISKHKAEYQNITVSTYLLGADQGGPAYATSMFADNVVTHRFNPQPAPQKIPTH